MNSATSLGSCDYVRPQRQVRLSHPGMSAGTPAVGSAVSTDLDEEELSEEKFIRYAEENPMRLLMLIGREVPLRPALLTFAAEAAGRIADTALVVAVLSPLLGHANPVVREGAVYGLTPHLDTSLEARHLLRERAAGETSPGVKAAIDEALATLD